MPKRVKTKNPHERKVRRTAKKKTDVATAFPVPAQTPGQTRSREAFDTFEKQHESARWWADYAHLRNEGFTWRIAAYIAWAASPLQMRWPATLKELATKVLGLKSDKVIYKWRRLNPEIEARVEKFRAEPLLRYRTDVLTALIDVASTPSPLSHPDRKMYLEMTGDYKPKAQTVLTGANDGPITFDFSELSDAELERIAAGAVSSEHPSPASGG